MKIISFNKDELIIETNKGNVVFNENNIHFSQKDQTPLYVPQLYPLTCFPFGKVTMAYGEKRKPISEIDLGDYVLAYDDITKENLPAMVIGVQKCYKKALYLLQTTNTPLLCSQEQRFGIFVDKTVIYKCAKDICKGDQLYGYIDNEAVMSIECSDQFFPVTMYHFTVEKYHTFYINNILVHNIKI